MNPDSRTAAQDVDENVRVRQRPFTVWLVVLIVTASALAPLLVFRNWFVNHDGGFYMALARNLTQGNGYTFPDGSIATFRGPAFAGLIAAAWSVFPDTSVVAIWSIRLVYIAIPVLVALVLWRLSGRWAVAALGGILAAVQPIALTSGTLWFVPDGLAAALVLAAVLVVVWNAPDLPGRTALLVSGALFGVAFLAKDTAILGVLVPIGWIASTAAGGVRRALTGALIMVGGLAVAVTPWALYTSLTVGRLPDGLGGLDPVVGFAVAAALLVVSGLGWIDYPRRGRTTMVLSPWLAIGVAIVSTLSALIVLGPPLVFPIRRTGWAIARLLDGSLYIDSPWILLVPAVLVAAVYAFKYLRDAAAIVATLVVAIGAAGIVYAAVADLGVRNGILFWYGLSMLVALGVDDLWTRYVRAALRVGVAAVVVAALIGSVWASGALNARTDPRIQSDEAPATIAAAEWIQRNVGDVPIIGTPRLLQTLWVLADGKPTLSLAPVHVTSRSRWLEGDRVFERTVDWAGDTAVSPSSGTAEFYQMTPNKTAAFFIAEIDSSIAATGSRYIVVTGNWEQPRSALDAGGLLPYLEASAGAVPVYRSDPDAGPQWVVVYRIDSALSADVPTLIHPSVGGSVPALGADEIVLNDTQYEALVREILGLPLEAIG